MVIAAKTDQENSRLPGTICSAAKEIEEAGGQCEFPSKVSPLFLEDVIIQIRLGGSLMACFPALGVRQFD